VSDLPTLDLVRDLLPEQQMITADHTMAYWPQELYLPGGVVDRANRDSWTKAGQPTLEKRALDEVERRLAAHAPLETDVRIDAEMRRILQVGMKEERPLPHTPPHDARPST
jgi:trimethylamine:corrinoid methyltransferase-like protein